MKGRVHDGSPGSVVHPDSGRAGETGQAARAKAPREADTTAAAGVA